MATQVPWRAAAITAVALALGASAQAHAQEPSARLDAPYLAPKLFVGFGGEQDVDVEVDITTTASVDATDDLELSYGIGIAYVHPLLGFFALGGQLSVGSWIASRSADEDQARDVYADLSAVPQLNFDPLRMLEVSLSVPVGFTLAFPGDDRPNPELETALARRVEVATGIGYHLGALLGVRIPLSDSFGLLAETGVLVHRVSQPVKILATRSVGGGAPGALPPSPSDETLDTDVSWLQGVLFAGVYF